MTKDNKHIDINLDFLDKNNSSKKGAPIYKPKITNKGSKVKKYNWKTILIIAGVVLFFCWAIFSEGNSNNNINTQSYTSSETLNSDSVVIGEYTCLRYHYNKAVALNPDETESQLISAQNSLEYQANELERLQNEIENSYVNEYSSQWAIDQYNEMIDEYNSKLTLYQSDADSLDSRIDRYNNQVEAHNNYLINNCISNR